MYSRVLYENWHSVVPIVAFAVTFTVFMSAFTRALVMRKDKAETMAAKPLDDGDAMQKEP
jgi:hypothetical protein